MKFILGTKQQMDQIFAEETGKMIPVTVVKAGPCFVTQIKTGKKDGYSAIQVAFGVKRENLLSKALQKHLKISQAKRYVREFRLKNDEESAKFSNGDKLTIANFKLGDTIGVTGVSKGKGFQGVVKRHGFAGSPASHGHKDQLRMPGSIGATDPARVFKGTRMAGRMGFDQVTTTGLKVVKIDEARNLLFIKGSVPGAINGLIMIKSQEGEMVAAPKSKQTEPDDKTRTEPKADKGIELNDAKQAELKEEK